MNNSIIENKEIPIKFQWEFILILKEVQQYISSEIVIKLSLLNKYLRVKLKNRVFNRIVINGYNVSHLENSFEFNRYGFENVPERDSKTMLKFKNTNIDPFMAEIVDTIDPLACYFKSITFFNLDRLGYYVVPIVLNFCRLSNLNISTCCIDIKYFKRLMEKLDKLQKLTLFQLDLIKSPEQGLNEHEIKFPHKLKEIYLGHIYVCSTNLPNTPYEFLVKYSGNIERNVFYLEPKNLSNLEKFELIGIIQNGRFITNFLTLTPKLTNLTLHVRNFSIQVMDVLSKNNCINELNLKFDFQDKLFPLDKKLAVLYSLHGLTLQFIIGSDQYLQICQLIQAFPNLTKLEIELEYYDPEFITKLLSKLTKLEALKLQTFTYYNNSIDLTLFTEVEFLKFYNYEKSKIIYKLPNPSNKLKKVILPLQNKNNKNNTELVNEMGKINANWMISLRGTEIHCRVVNIKKLY
jgi:hypothetical protein